MRQIILLALATTLLLACSQEEKGSEMDGFVDDLMSQMTIEEKIGQLNLITPGGGIPTGSAVSTDVEAKIIEGKVGGIFGVTGPEKVRQAQTLAVERSRLKIPMLFGSDVIHGYKTVFPIPLGLSASWDMAMIEKTARVAAEEATADGLNWNFSPMVDISRDARWGRVAEGGGEDPYLGSQIARAMVRGYQGDDLTAANTMMATVKHFALYGAPEGGRDYNTVDMSRIRMFNDYFPPFLAAIEEGAGSIMTSFNDVDGVPASANKWLLTDILRDRWDFDGFVVSDYTSVNEMVDHGLGDLQAVSALALKAGLDMDMVGEGFLTTLKNSLDEGTVSEEAINKACRRILQAKYQLGLFDDPYRYIDDSRPENRILTEANRSFARDVAARSAVLLKNANQTLPLGRHTRIALVGPLANNKNNMLGTWAVSGDPQMSVPLLEGLQKSLGTNARIQYAKGANISDDPAFAEKVNVFGTRIDIDERSPELMLREALTMANSSDVIVAVVGEASEMSGESSSRSDITLPENQKKLVRALAQTGKPLVLVIMSGRPLALEEENELADALLLTWHAGIEAGNGIADVLLGVYNPSGKLTMTFPRNVGQTPIYYNQRVTGRPNPGDEFQKFRSNYLDVPNSPLFAFGYGLSYTSFEYSDVVIDETSIQPDGQLKASVKVTNTGDFEGEEVVQLYIRDVIRSLTPPVKELKAFEKINLKPGESKEVTFTLNVDDLAFYHQDLRLAAESGDFKVFIGPNSDTDNSTDFRLEE
ncbi:beta-glucosidase BglX [Geofilum rubicundum]|uniref:Periplasmic beta-glucosidase n=1 Tax=Geofilum rubicundum JCM 15548 TaxID=1236989 RepID=A0A0E9LWC1_9BACT|nr:beta-glucosidase BglX [Geofilum rubicundum]GAO29608.1 periplasmic beta-glucosidase [Geofilum rubicundum JCM 15548]